MVACFFVFCAAAHAQTPRVFLRFDGNLNDSSGAGLITSPVTPSVGFSPTYNVPDRNGVTSRALVFTSGSSLQLVAPSLSGNSNQVLGLRNAAGTNTSFTLAAWVKFTSLGSGQGYSTIFGNLGSGAGTLHAGLNVNSDKAHFGFDNGNDLNGSTTSIVPNVWYHIAFVYDTAAADGPVQRIYVNGVPEATRTGVTNTIIAGDLYVGNWGTATNAANDLKGHLDDVLVYNVALSPDRIQALFDGVNPLSLPAAGTYSGPKLPGFAGAEGFWGIREIRGYPGISLNTAGGSSLVNADRVLRAYPATPGGTVAEYQRSVINVVDDESAGDLGIFPNEAGFGTNTPGPDDDQVFVAKCSVRIEEEDDYTFGFLGDEGSRLRILGKQWSGSTRLATANVANPAHGGDSLWHPNETINSQTLGVVHLLPGDYNLELVWWEGTGTSAIEVFAARGAKTAIDGTFQLIGNSAAGGLELVRDPDTVPQILTFTVNGGNSLEVHSGVPSTFTMAWQTNAIPTSVTITPSPGVVGQTGSLLVASPTSTTTYTLTATDGVNTAVRTVTVFVDSLPVINSFIANDTTVTSGTSVTLIWSAAGATSLTLQPGNIDVTGQSSRVVTPTVDTTYTLIATNIEGSAQQSVAIDIGVAPVVNTFAAADANPLYGAETSLNWDVTGATTLSINQAIGAVTGATGSVSVTPIATTTYTLTATNLFGVTTRNTTVNQATPIGVLAPGFTARRVSATTPFPFATPPGTPRSYLQSAVAVLGGQNAGATTTANYTTVNFSDGADGDFTAGNAAFPGGGGDNFAVQITATLVVNSPGEYTFVVNSDDGARLRVDGVDIITDDSTHFPGASAGRIMLTKRTSTLELIYYDATGGAEVELGWVRPNQTFQLLGVISSAPTIVRGQVLISEFMADNNNTLLDEDGDSSDWVEIWNSTTAPVDLSTYYLTDEQGVPNKWNFPAMILPANGYLVVFASGKNKVNPAFNLHTDFNLAQTGDYLALSRSNGAGGYITVSEFAPLFPPQSEDQSYGSSDSEGYIGYMETPTPGQPNARTVVGFVEEVIFSHQRGRYAAAFNLALSTSTPGATIRYTTNGSLPTANTGTLYTGPVAIGITTCFRAAAFKAGWKPTDVGTHSYMFVDDIVTQTTATATAKGFPSGAVNGQVYRYGLSVANVTAGGGNLQSLKNALAAAPTVCLTTPIENFSHATTGIYSNPAGRGLFWERPVSMEYISAAGTSEFQIDCGFRIRGGYSRSTNNPKHAFHMYFRGSLYDGDLKYRLFGTSGAAQFDSIDLRCSQNYSWSFENNSQNSMIREEWSRVTQGAMNQPWARLSYFHLYINGIYWGVYDFEERTDANFGATYLGGVSENYDTVKSTGSPGGYNTEMTDGNFIAWQSLFTQCVALKNDNTSEASRTARYMQMRGLNPDGSSNANYPPLLDVDNLVDYLLVVYYDGSFDSPMSTFLSNASNNWFGIRDRLGMRGFTFFAHDHEHGMDSVTDGRSYNRIGPWGGSGTNNWNQGQYGSRETFTKFNPHYVHEFLCFSAEYRQRFADRVQRHCFNGGALTTVASTARTNALAAMVDAVIHAEAARWGSTGLHRNTWLAAKNGVLNFVTSGGAVPGGHPPLTPGDRTSILVQQARGYQDPVGSAKALFPATTLNAPNFSGQFGGAVTNPHSFNITNPNGGGTAIYYTVNGVDPRAIGGGIAAGAQTGASPIPITLNSSSTVRARIYNSTTLQWSALVEAEYLVGALASPTNLVVSKLHYHPPDTNPDAEFIEFMNISATPIDLSNVRFTIGLQFQFPDGFLLAPGARTLVVKSKAAFDALYPGVLPMQVGGIYAGVFINSSLDNAGEQLQIKGNNDVIIRDFIFDDNNPPATPPWPESPDGDGPCLVLMKPESNPDHSVATNWRPSNTVGGTPGASDATSYAAWAITNGISNPNLDNDFDGTSNFGEYARGTNPNAANPDTTATLGTLTLNIGGNVGDYLVLSFRRPLGRDDASYNVKATGDLATWQNAVLVGTGVYNGDGTETITYRYPVPKSADSRQFLQLQMIKLP